MERPDDMMLAKTPRPPYVAVIFTSIRMTGDEKAYAEMAEEMDRLAADQPGYLGIESARDRDGFGITVSYWESEVAAKAWKENLEHRKAQDLGRTKWYSAYHVRIATVFRAYEKGSSDNPSL